jgi:tripeptidyl-peptidase-1
MKLALQGVTVLISSGDGGIAGNTDTCWGPKEDHWTVSAPGSCPYVTAVGGTKLKPGVDILHPSENPELGYVASAGGISAIFERPKWQESFVTEYLETASIAAPGFTELAPLVANDTVLADLLPDLGNGLRSLSGRGLPDISALASISSTYVIDEGVVYPVGGTSVSALYVGAIISRINLERLAIGKPVVGFINPVLYKYADTIVRDITGGDDNGRCNQTGYPTTVGWDAVTGLGVLKYKEALDLWLSL